MRRAQAAMPLTIAAMLVAGCGARSSAGGDAHPIGTATAPVRPLFTREPEVGVACPGMPNSIACDRVGVAVWLARPAVGMTATVEGQPLRLRRPHTAGGWWEGYLQPAGLLDGALRVHPDRGRSYWQGSHPRDAHLTLRIMRASGAIDPASATVALRPGWG
jgi:hypothetical protein